MEHAARKSMSSHQDRALRASADDAGQASVPPLAALSIEKVALVEPSFKLGPCPCTPETLASQLQSGLGTLPLAVSETPKHFRFARSGPPSRIGAKNRLPTALRSVVAGGRGSRSTRLALAPQAFPQTCYWILRRFKRCQGKFKLSTFVESCSLVGSGAMISGHG